MHLMTHCLKSVTLDKASEDERLESLIVAMFFFAWPSCGRGR